MKPIFEEEKQFLSKFNIVLPNNCWRDGTKIYLDPTCNKPLYILDIQDGNITIKKDNMKFFENYKQKNIQELINLNKERLNRLEQDALKLIFYSIITLPFSLCNILLFLFISYQNI